MSTQKRTPSAIDWKLSATNVLDDENITSKLKESSNLFLGTFEMEPFFYHVLQEEVGNNANTTMLVHSQYTMEALSVAGKVSANDPLKKLKTISYDNERHEWVPISVNSGVDGCGGKLLFLPFALKLHWVLVVMRLPSDKSIFPAYLYDSLPGHYSKEDLRILTIATTLIVERILGWPPGDDVCVHLIRKESPEQRKGSNNCAIHVLQTFRILATRTQKIGQAIMKVPDYQRVTRPSLLQLIQNGAMQYQAPRR